MQPHALLPTLDIFPIFNRDHGLKNLGYNLRLLRDMIQAMVSEMSTETADLQRAYTEKNWKAVEELAHKMKGGASYIGIIKLQYACLYLESYCHKGGPIPILEYCYQRVVQTCDETQKTLQLWLLEQI